MLKANAFLTSTLLTCSWVIAPCWRTNNLRHGTSHPSPLPPPYIRGMPKMNLFIYLFDLLRKIWKFDLYHLFLHLKALIYMAMPWRDSLTSRDCWETFPKHGRKESLRELDELTVGTASHFLHGWILAQNQTSICQPSTKTDISIPQHTFVYQMSAKTDIRY